MRLIFPFLAVALCQGAITNLRVTGVIATQAIFEYTAPTSSACTAQVSETPTTYSPLVNDVNTALFSGSSTDTRTGNITAGRSRMFVVGKQTAEKASDNIYYSRALQNATVHYVKVTCGGDTAETSFRTGDYPAGITWNEQIGPSDPNNLTVAAVPTYDFNNRSQKWVDPATGMLVRHMTFPNQEVVGGNSDYNFGYASSAAGASCVSGNWVNPCNILAGDGAFTTFSAATQDVLCVRATYAYDFTKNLNGLAFELRGFVANTATGNDRQVEVAMSIDGCQTAYSGWLTATLPIQSAYAPTGTDLSIGDSTTNPTPIMAAWFPAGTVPPRNFDMNMRTGTVDTNGTAATYNTAGSSTGNAWTFLPATHVGSPIEINTGSGFVPFTTAAFGSTTAMTLNASAGVSGSPVDYRTPTFSFMLRKKTTSTDQISLDYAHFADVLYSGTQMNGGGGSTQMCATRPTPEGWVVTAVSNATPVQITVSAGPSTLNTGDTLIIAGGRAANVIGTWLIHKIDATHYTLDGSTGTITVTTPGAVAYTPTARQGYHCAVWSTYPVDWHTFWIEVTTGDAHYLGPLWTHGAAGLNGCGGAAVTWDSTDTVFDAEACAVQYSSDANKWHMVRERYVGNPTLGYNADVGPQPNTGDADAIASWEQTDLTPAPNDIMTQIVAFTASSTPTWDLSVFPGVTSDGSQNGYYMLHSTADRQDSLGWRVVFDPNQAAGSQIIAAASSWAQLPTTYCSLHTASVLEQTPWLITVLKSNIEGGRYNGPYYSSLTSGAVSGTPGDCASLIAGIGQTNVLGLSGSHCTQITVGSEPTTPPDVTPANSVLMSAPVGQPFDFVLPGGSLEGETVRLAARNGLTWIIERGFDVNNTVIAHPGTDKLFAQCGALNYKLLNYNSQETPFGWWNFAADPHALNANDPYGLQGGNSNATQICSTCTMRKEDTFQSMGHFTSSNGVTINDSGTNLLIPADCPNPGGAGSAYYGGYGFRVQAWPTHLTQYATTCVANNAAFTTGVWGNATGNSTETHPSLEGLSGIMYDGRPKNPYSDLGAFPETVTHVSGYLYKITGILPTGGNAKISQYFYMTQKHSFLNISGPSSSIGTTGSDAWKVCFAYAAGECRGGSSAGDWYVNNPLASALPNGFSNAGTFACFAKDNAFFDAYDICFGTIGSESDFLIQAKFPGPDYTGANSRKVSTLGNLPKNAGKTWNTRSLPDGSWMFSDNYVGEISHQVLLVKTPPFPGFNSVNRAQYEQIAVKLTAPVGLSVDNAIIEYGYDASLNCYQRTGESCVAAASNAPYFYSVADAPITGVSCATTCAPSMPVIPQKIAYWRAVYRNGTSVVARSAIQPIAVP